MPFVHTNDIFTYYEFRDFCVPDPLVFIHCFRHDHSIWKPQLNYFSQMYPVLTYDLRGHGQSEKSNVDYSVDLLASDLRELLKALNLRKPHLVGTSIGGMIAEQFALRYPNDVNTVSLVSTPIPQYDNTSLKIAAYIIYTELKKFLKKRQTTIPIGEMSKFYKAMAEFETDLLRINIPTLIINGELEHKVLIESARQLEKKTGAPRVIIPNAGHNPNISNPEAFNRALELFLAEYYFAEREPLDKLMLM